MDEPEDQDESLVDAALPVDGESSASDSQADQTAPNPARLQRRLTNRGRELADSKAENERLSARLTALEADKERELSAVQEARIAALPKEDQALVRVDMLERQIAARDAEAAAVAYKEKRAAELVRQANEHYGLEGENAITFDDELDDRNEPAFFASLRAIGSERARHIARSGGATTVTTTKKNDEAPDALAAAAAAGAKAALKELGLEAGRPVSPQPVGGTTGTDEDTSKILLNKRTTPMEKRAQLAEVKQSALSKAR